MTVLASSFFRLFAEGIARCHVAAPCSTFHKAVDLESLKARVSTCSELALHSILTNNCCEESHEGMAEDLKKLAPLRFLQARSNTPVVFWMLRVVKVEEAICRSRPACRKP